MTALLSIRGLQTFYGNIQALKGVDLDVNEGEIVTLIGANGAGKSTLMMTIFGNPRAREGSIVFEGRDITHLPTHEIARLRIAQSPEGRRIFPRMTVLENLQMGATVADGDHFAEDLEARLHALPAAGKAHRPARRHAVRRRAADAGDRPRADEPPSPAAARRAVARPGATDREADLPRHPRIEPAARSSPFSWSSRTPSTRSSSRTAAMSWSTARSPCRGSGQDLLERPEVRAAYLEGGRH